MKEGKKDNSQAENDGRDESSLSADSALSPPAVGTSWDCWTKGSEDRTSTPGVFCVPFLLFCGGRGQFASGTDAFKDVPGDERVQNS